MVVVYLAWCQKVRFEKDLSHFISLVDGTSKVFEHRFRLLI